MVADDIGFLAQFRRRALPRGAATLFDIVAAAHTYCAYSPPPMPGLKCLKRRLDFAMHARIRDGAPGQLGGAARLSLRAVLISEEGACAGDEIDYQERVRMAYI